MKSLLPLQMQARNLRLTISASAFMLWAAHLLAPEERLDFQCPHPVDGIERAM